MIEPALIRFAETLADAAASLLADRALANAEMKPDRTFVTEADREIERHLRAMIAHAHPDHGVLGEEFEATRTDAEFVWILDPIDGTAAYIAGMPVYSTLIALAQSGVPILGIMHLHATRERWVGVCGATTTYNGRPCRTRASAALASAVISASSPDFFGEREKQALAAINARTAWRIYGGAALSYGRLASGRIDLAIDAGLKIYDYAAFVPIIEGAGGIITDWQGAALTIASGPCVLAAGDRRRHAEALDIVREAID